MHDKNIAFKKDLVIAIGKAVATLNDGDELDTVVNGVIAELVSSASKLLSLVGIDRIEVEHSSDDFKTTPATVTLMIKGSVPVVKH